MAFRPNSLRIGLVAAVLLYNFFTRLTSASPDRISGAPNIGYFDDFGSLVRTEISRETIRTFGEFGATMWIQLEEKTKDVGRLLVKIEAFSL